MRLLAAGARMNRGEQLRRKADRVKELHLLGIDVDSIAERVGMGRVWVQEQLWAAGERPNYGHVSGRPTGQLVRALRRYGRGG